jgi:hypothetical protein
MQKLFTLLIIVLFTNTIVAGQTDVTDIRFGSSGDPLNGLSIAWNSSGESDKIAWGYTSELGKGEFDAQKSVSITGTRFEYTFPEVSAASQIYYKIFDSKDNVWTEVKTYKTASNAPNDNFRFTVLGDSRTYPDAWKTISEATLDTDFTLFMGDIVADGKKASDWDAWFDYGKIFIARELVYHCVGNHDDDDSPSGFDNVMGLYTLPSNELYYSFNYGNAVFICLNSEDPNNDVQYNWLISTLEANKEKTWKIVFFHKPFYTAPSHTGEMDAYFNTWWKAFDDYGVDMIFNGHTHNYQRTVPVNRNISTNSAVESYGSGDDQGRCQIVAGNAGAPESNPASSSFWWLDNSVKGRHFCDVEIDGAKLTMKAMFADHTVFDSLTLDKENSEISFQVNVSEVTDIFDGGAVWLVFGERDSIFEMTDTDGDNIYTYSMSIPIETALRYNYSYQTGANPDTDFIEESVATECSDAEGYRTLIVPYGNLTLPAVMFGTCEQAPQDVTFHVDMSYITDLYDGGAVWLVFGDWESSFEMADPDGDDIYTLTVPVAAGTDLKYFFSYQNGADPNSNKIEESVIGDCSDGSGNRIVYVPESSLALSEVLFGSCMEDPGPNPTLKIMVSDPNDDSEEQLTDEPEKHTAGYIDDGSSDLELGSENVSSGGVPQIVGIGFRDVQVPFGATITNAYIQFSSDSDEDSEVVLKIWGEAATNSSLPFLSTDFNISSRTKTNSMVEWTPDAWASGDRTEAQQTPDLSTIINEIISDVAWAAGNNITFLIEPKDGAYTATNTEGLHREGVPYETDATKAPELVITFNATGVASAVTESSNIYPNPAVGVFYINNPSTDEFSYKIFSVTGQLVAHKDNIRNTKTKVDVSEFAKGVYFVSVESGDTKGSHKLIVK